MFRFFFSLTLSLSLVTLPDIHEFFFVHFHHRHFRAILDSEYLVNKTLCGQSVMDLDIFDVHFSFIKVGSRFHTEMAALFYRLHLQSRVSVSVILLLSVVLGCLAPFSVRTWYSAETFSNISRRNQFIRGVVKVLLQFTHSRGKLMEF